MTGLCAFTMNAQEQQTKEAEAKTAKSEQNVQTEQTYGQGREREFKGFNISVQGGALYSMNENAWTFNNDGRIENASLLQQAKDILKGDYTKRTTVQGSLTVGYDFGHRLGARLQFGYSLNSSAGNHKETAAAGFYPYSFNALTGFADAVLNISGLINEEKQHLFETKIYAGIGAGKSSLGDDRYISKHPWYDLNFDKAAFGFRGGIIEEMYINKNLGAFIDLGLEAFTDGFNGMNPSGKTTADDDNFPLDLRLIGSLGLTYHF